MSVNTILARARRLMKKCFSQAVQKHPDARHVKT
jgi:hypothetical protein